MAEKEEIVAYMKPIEVLVKSLSLFQIYKQLQVTILIFIEDNLTLKNFLVGFVSL